MKRDLTIEELTYVASCLRDGDTTRQQIVDDLKKSTITPNHPVFISTVKSMTSAIEDMTDEEFDKLDFSMVLDSAY